MIVVLAGVTGSGKTTVGYALSRQTGWPFVDADDFHSAANKEKMHQGIPLTDEDRASWLDHLHDVLLGWYRGGTSGILACSALKQAYRLKLSADIPGCGIRFIWLDVPPELLAERVGRRNHPFMNPDLLPSQLAEAEIPEVAVRIAASDSPAGTAQRILDQLSNTGTAAD